MSMGLCPRPVAAVRYPFLNASTYCDTPALMTLAWDTFGPVQPGWTQVQAICDWVHARIRFDYGASPPHNTASQALATGAGVCRDFAHLAISLCRCLNLPARYCTGYLGYTGIPAGPAPVDFSAWFEVFLEDGWFVFDARHNRPRCGRVLIARGRDAADVPFLRSFGAHQLVGFQVVTESDRGPRWGYWIVLSASGCSRCLPAEGGAAGLQRGLLRALLPLLLLAQLLSACNAPSATPGPTPHAQVEAQEAMVERQDLPEPFSSLQPSLLPSLSNPYAPPLGAGGFQAP